MNFLVSIHPWIGYLVSAALLAATVLAFVRARSAAAFDRRPYSVTAILVDVQVTLGIIVYFIADASARGAAIAVVHPLLALLALGAVHAGLGAARGAPDAAQRHRRVALGFTGGIVLVLATIGVGSAA